MVKLLIVEDDKNQRCLYEQEFRNEGYEVILASNGQEALEAAEKEIPDLVIMDISMPGMDGIETMGKLLAKDRKMLIILNTAYANYKDNFMSWSAEDYVVKSSNLDELKQKVRTVLKKRGISVEKGREPQT